MDDLEKLLGSFRSLLIVAGIKQIYIGKASIEKYTDAYDWLHQFSLCDQLKKMNWAYGLRTPEIWDMYKHLGLEETREQAALAAASEELRKRWRVNRPSVFKSKKYCFKCDNTGFMNYELLPPDLAVEDRLAWIGQQEDVKVCDHE